MIPAAVQVGASVDPRRPAASPAPFDAIADRYDATFSDHPMGRVLRAAVWRQVDAAFHPGMVALDLGCGTGEDALHLAERGLRVVGVDASDAMIHVARAKVAATGRADQVELATLNIEDGLGGQGGLGGLGVGAGPFDAVLANFGVLNCLSEASLQRLGADLAALVRPRGPFIAVVMGPRCAWEILWYGVRGDFGRALRRRRREGVVAELGSGPLTVHYPGVRDLSDALTPRFRLVETLAIGSVLPPSYAASWLAQRPRALAWLARVDRRIERWRVSVALADHYLARFERVAF
jgi:SAM-dependent methyltransferase